MTRIDSPSPISYENYFLKTPLLLNKNSIILSIVLLSDSLTFPCPSSVNDSGMKNFQFSQGCKDSYVNRNRELEWVGGVLKLSCVVFGRAAEWMTLNWNAITWPGHALSRGLRQQLRGKDYNKDFSARVCRSNGFMGDAGQDFGFLYLSSGVSLYLKTSWFAWLNPWHFPWKTFVRRNATPPCRRPVHHVNGCGCIRLEWF